MTAPSFKLLSSAQLILSFAQLLHSSCRSSAVICSSGQQLPAGYADPSDTNQVLMMLRGSHHQGGGFMSSGAGEQHDQGGGDEEGIVKFCPDRCSCNFTIANQLQVTCDSHFNMDFPISALRKDIEVLKIIPRCRKYQDDLRKEGECLERRENILNLGPHFRYLRLLKVLAITDSQIPNLGTKTLILLGSLRVLDLSRNRLTALIDKNFEGLHSLKEMYLDGNLIKSMISAAFRFVPQLEILSLRDNRIEELAPRIFYKLKHLKYLDLSGNKLGRFEGGVFQDTPSLETFACENCGIFAFHVPDAYRDRVDNLHSLFLKNNTLRRMTDISPAMLEHLEVFDLSLNDLDVLDALNSSRLRALNLARNNISKVAVCALCNTSMQNLNLGYNKIVRLDLNVLPNQEVKTMQTLSLSGNWLDMTSLRDLLDRFPTLEILDLDHTGIVSLPQDLFYSNYALKRLNLSQNLLIDVDAQVFSHLSRLESLDLSSNFLVGPSDAFFKGVEENKRMRMVYLQKNSFRCDRCHIKPLLRFLRSSLMYWGACFKADGPLCLKCSHPDDMKYKHIEDLELTDDSLPQCDIPYHRVHIGVHQSRAASIWNTNSPYLACGIIIVIVVVLLAVTSIKYRHYGVYMTHESNPSNGLVDDGGRTQATDEEEMLRDPVVVLDRNAESYINLKYPILPHDPSSEATKEISVTQPIQYPLPENGHHQLNNGLGYSSHCDSSYNGSYIMTATTATTTTAATADNSSNNSGSYFYSLYNNGSSNNGGSNIRPGGGGEIL